MRLPGLRDRDAPGSATLGVALVLAQAAFALTFRGPRHRFWPRMTTTGLVLGSYALAVSPPARRLRIGGREIGLGLASAAILYATFRVGDRIARRLMPGGEREIAEIYALRRLRPPAELAFRLTAIVGPAEELFWRGTVQAALMRLLGRWRGSVLAVAAYGGVHLVTANLTLTGAAAVAGAHWGLLYALGAPLGALVVSHALWDVWIFLVRPTQEVGDDRTRADFPAGGRIGQVEPRRGPSTPAPFTR